MSLRSCASSSRPRLARQGRHLSAKTRFATIARLPLAPSRLVMHPTVFLLHLAGITFGTCLVPLVGARMASSRARAGEKPLLADRDEEPALQPSPVQLRRLASILRTQVADASHGFDALFTLRQLHMLKPPRPPILSSLASPALAASFVPEKWMWRLPSAAAIHAIVRGREASLVNTAASLAINALRWDRLMHEALREQAGLQPEPSMYSIVGRGQENRLSPARIEDGLLKETRPVQVVVNPSLPETLPSSLVSAPVSSLSPKTLEALFLFLAQTPGRSDAVTLSALQISFALSRLSLPVSTQMHWHTFSICREIGREDLAVLAWEKWLETVQATGKGNGPLVKAFKALKVMLRPRGMRFAVQPSQATLAAVAHLARMLDRQHARPAPALRTYDPVPDLVNLLSTFDLPTSIAPGPSTSHLQIFSLVKTVLVRVLEKLLDAPILLHVQDGCIVGPSNTPPRLAPPRFRRSLPVYTSLLVYSLRTLQSPNIALALLDRIPADHLSKSPELHNVLLSSSSAELARHWSRQGRAPENERTLPTFIAYLTRASMFVDIEEIVFRVLPELDLSSRAKGIPAFELPAVQPPPGRSPYLYVTLLNALQKSGRTGLAERVFRSARWAAELSRQGDATDGWRLPPAAFSIMLSLYAAEAKKGKPAPDLPILDGRPSNRYVVGWGRHAIRVFFIKKEQALLAERLGPTVEVRGRRSRRSPVVPRILRSEAAPIVALWELEGGSKMLESESLQIALNSRFSAEALHTLFPSRGTARARQVRRRRLSRKETIRVFVAEERRRAA